MIRTTPFHERVAALNQTGLWSHWAGHLVADKYQLSEKFEYLAVRNSAGVFDTSPLYKYRLVGPEAERFLSGVLARDVRRCAPGRAQYTIWCDDDGYIMEDGVVFRLSPDEFFLTAARPNLAYLTGLADGMRVTITDESGAWAGLAVQGPRSRLILEQVVPGVAGLGYFHHTDGRAAGVPVLVSRTGFTGDLGYELWAPADGAVRVWDAVLEAGADWGMLPFGQIALSMARIEAGLLLIDVDFTSARFAWTRAQKSTPLELGLGWMVRDLDRPFIGRQAIRDQIADGSSRYRFTGLVVDWQEWDALYDGAGHIPPKDHVPVEEDRMIYDEGGDRVGWASSSMYSPMLQRHIALARVRPELARPGTRVELEVTIDHQHHTVGALTAPLPLFDPERKTA